MEILKKMYPIPFQIFHASKDTYEMVAAAISIVTHNGMSNILYFREREINSDEENITELQFFILTDLK